MEFYKKIIMSKAKIEWLPVKNINIKINIINKKIINISKKKYNKNN